MPSAEDASGSDEGEAAAGGERAGGAEGASGADAAAYSAPRDMSAPMDPEERAAIDAIDAVARAFFAAFDNRGGATMDVRGLRALFAPGAIITPCAVPEVQCLDVEAFLAPRVALLTGGRLVEFAEHEESAQTEVFGQMARRRCVYAKAGILDGAPYAGRGVKFMQLVRLAGAWRLTAVAWEDERDGLLVPATTAR